MKISSLLRSSDWNPQSTVSNEEVSRKRADIPSLIQFDKGYFRASLVVQWLRVRLPMQGTRVRALVWEDPTCRGATRPVRHNY